MLSKEQNDIWQDLKEIWNNQPESEKINIQASNLILELKSKVSQFEKDSIRKDIKFIRSSTSLFEKDSIKKDLQTISNYIRKIIDKFRNNK
ncbi:hypothetical protein [Maribellus sediminis]|uniref:hypothetical protein n=1 Tax=Maribellus sediminis TaxID=2696285 RepID=UPI0014303F3E|nr:hypothetical protein [Maribellus sediminis]